MHTSLLVSLALSLAAGGADVGDSRRRMRPVPLDEGRRIARIGTWQAFDEREPRVS